ncbi:unnamed protein product [Mytilus coruscus]|uniref:Uncharacterized protein n=1 Tax=Mytilus coruscus TaxID=42192 RepID=A0A6J8ADR8_MYTCO|nr:unnamed protein product [Mytilus coruscus]
MTEDDYQSQIEYPFDSEIKGHLPIRRDTYKERRKTNAFEEIDYKSQGMYQTDSETEALCALLNDTFQEGKRFKLPTTGTEDTYQVERKRPGYLESKRFKLPTTATEDTYQVERKRPGYLENERFKLPTTATEDTYQVERKRPGYLEIDDESQGSKDKLRLSKLNENIVMKIHNMADKNKLPATATEDICQVERKTPGYLEYWDEKPHKSLHFKAKVLKSLVENWILLKENGNATTWKNKFLKHKLLRNRDIKAWGTKIKRSELVERLLMKALEKAETLKEIELINDVVCKDVGNLRALRREPTTNFGKEEETLLKNRCKIEDLLSREDTIIIKDHLVQEGIIKLTLNESLLTDEKHFPDRKSSMITEVMEILINNFHLGSYRCLTQSLDIKSKTKRQKQITQILKNVSVTDSMQKALQPTRIENTQSKYYDKDLDDKTCFQMKIRTENQSGREIKAVYEPIRNNPEIVNMILTSNFAASAGKTSEGSLVINFHMMERNMQNYLKQRLRNGNVSTVVQMLFNEISIKDVVPSGELLLNVKIEVNEDSSLSETYSAMSSNMQFVLHNKSFLIEEMDTDAMEKGLTKLGIRKGYYGYCKGRKQKATRIIDDMLTLHHEDAIINVIKGNEENGFGYLLQRLQTYETVYTSGNFHDSK